MTSPPPYHHVLVAVALSDESEQLLRRAKSLAHHYQARLTMLHVLEHTTVVITVPDLSEIYAALRRDAEIKMSQLATACGLEESACLIREGRPASVIHDEAEQGGVDLIVVGTHARGGMARLLLGSTANDIVNNSDCDVLSVRVGQG